MKALLIDPYKCTVTEVDVDGSTTLAHTLMHIPKGERIHLSGMIKSNNYLFINSKGWAAFNAHACSFELKYGGNCRHILGYGMIYGFDFHTRKLSDCSFTPDELENIITWHNEFSTWLATITLEQF